MNLWFNLIILSVLFNGLKYSVSDSESKSGCEGNEAVKVFNIQNCVAAIYGVDLVSLIGGVFDKQPKPESMCCGQMDPACAYIKAAKTHCKLKSDYLESAKKMVDNIRNVNCKGITPSKSVCTPLMTNKKGSDCADHQYLCDDPDLYNSVHPISMNGLILGLSLIISLISLL